MEKYENILDFMQPYGALKIQSQTFCKVIEISNKTVKTAWFIRSLYKSSKMFRSLAQTIYKDRPTENFVNLLRLIGLPVQAPIDYNWIRQAFLCLYGFLFRLSYFFGLGSCLILLGIAWVLHIVVIVVFKPIVYSELFFLAYFKKKKIILVL